MYSYRYSQGQWSSIDDPLQGKSLTDSDYHSVGDYSDGEVHLKYSSGDLVCSGLPFGIYSYTLSPNFPFGLSQAKTPAHIPVYKFCCVLTIGPTHCFVWVPDLPDLLQLLQSLRITAKQEEIPYLSGLVSAAMDVCGKGLDVHLVQPD